MDGCYYFIDYDYEGVAKGDPNEEVFQGPPNFPEIDEIIDNSDEERAANSYDLYVGAEVMLPGWKSEKIIGKFSKRVRYDDKSTGKGNYNVIHYKSLYKVEYPCGTTEILAGDIIDEIFCHKFTLKVITIKYRLK